MFALINQGQLYTDSAGYPVKIIRCINNTVLYRRMDGRTQSVKISDFNESFERIDHQEYQTNSGRNRAGSSSEKITSNEKEIENE